MKSTEKSIVSLDMGGGGFKEAAPEELARFHRPVTIDASTAVILFSPDAGRARDEYFIPNLHNGLFRIQAYLNAHACCCELICTDIDDMDEVWGAIRRFKPPLIGFSSYYNTMEKDFRNMRLAREHSPESILIAGGFEPSLNPQWQDTGGLVDAIIAGEGEAPLLRLCREMMACSSREGSPVTRKGFIDHLVRVCGKAPIPGLTVFREGSRAVSCPFERMSEDLYRDITRNAFVTQIRTSPVRSYWEFTHLLFAGTKAPFYRFVSSENCPWKCRFCQSSVFYSALLGRRVPKVNMLSDGDIVEIIVTAASAFPFLRYIYIDDENFFINMRRTKKTALAIAELKKTGALRRDLFFISRARSHQVTPELCGMLARAGWKMLSIGSESYAQEELDFLQKRTTVQDNLNAVRSITEAGMQAAENYILYTPITTAATFTSTVSSACMNMSRYNADGAATLFITPLPGTFFWGSGAFERTGPPPDTGALWRNKAWFTNASTGYEYVGYSIAVPGCSKLLPHPEITLPDDPLMRHVALCATAELPQYIQTCTAHLASDCLRSSRRFITLVNFYAAVDRLQKETGERHFAELKSDIVVTIASLADTDRQ